MTNNILLIFVIALLTACSGDPNENVDEGSIEDGVYYSSELGWKMSIPEGWINTTKDAIEETNDRGKELLEQEFGEVDYSGLKNLLSFHLNEVNMFSSTSQPFELEYEGEWEESNTSLKTMMFDILQNQGLKLDSTITSNETIDGIEFKKYTFHMQAPEGGPEFDQVMYSAYINGFDFGVVMLYDSKRNYSEMMEVWQKSTFEKE